MEYAEMDVWARHAPTEARSAIVQAILTSRGSLAWMQGAAAGASSDARGMNTARGKGTPPLAVV